LKRTFLLLFLTIGLLLKAAWAIAQVDKPLGLIVDTLPPKAASSTLLNPPLGLLTDTIVPDAASSTAAAFRDSAVVDLSKLKLSDDGLSESIEYGARDSMWFDVLNKQVHLYGLATVKYTSLEIKANYILLDYAANEIAASMFPDSSGKMTGTPEFKDKEQAFQANKLRYNFKTKKGIIYEARTQQEDLYVLGQKAKFIGPPDGDTITRNIIYNKDAILTTCNADHPHFGIRSRKLKVIPDKLVVTGLSNLEVAGIPTPFVLPFGFYPITKTRKAGLIIPQDFQFADREGLGLQNFGWYQPINDHMDAKVLFNAFVSGTLGVQGDLRYNYIYQSQGSVQISYNRRVRENDRAQKEVFPSFGLRISHSQDAKAHPSRKLNGSVNIETNRNQNRNQNDYASVYQNQLQSNLTFSKTFPGKPYNFTAAFTHTQSTQTRKMNITLPTINFQVQQIYPFKRKNGVGSERWYEKITLRYSAQGSNQFRDVPDTTLFTRETLRRAQAGIQHKASSDLNFKLFRYINLTPNVSYEENWYPYTVERQLVNEINYVRDTVFQNGEIVSISVDSNATKWGRDTLIRNYGFKSFRTFTAGMSASTSLFATYQFKKGWLRGIRHKISPSMGINYAPDFSQNENYFREIAASLRPGATTRRYSIFDEAVYGRPSSSSQSIVLNYSLLNVLEMKHASKRDTTGRGKKVSIFKNLTFSGSYNLTADTLKWSTIGTSGNIPLLKGISTLTWSVRFDPYTLDQRGRRVNQFMLRENGRLLRLDQLGFQLNTGTTVGKIREMIENRDKTSDQTSTSATAQQRDDFVSWFDNFNIAHYISFERQYISGTNRDTFLIGQHNIRLSGSIPVSAKWRINISNISYDLQANQFVYPDLGITRDLHCWEMSLSWQPTRGTYNFTINAKPGTFAFLKVPYRKNNFDGSGGF
jgi:LptD protein